MVSMMERVARDNARITSTDFATDLIFTPPGGDPVTVKGYASKHSLDVSEIGMITINSKRAYCGVSERVLLAAGYTTRDMSGNLLNFDKHLVTYTDVSGQTMTYIVQKSQSKPDETVQVIVFILGYYTPPTP